MKYFYQEFCCWSTCLFIILVKLWAYGRLPSAINCFWFLMVNQGQQYWVNMVRAWGCFVCNTCLSCFLRNCRYCAKNEICLGAPGWLSGYSRSLLILGLWIQLPFFFIRTPVMALDLHIIQNNLLYLKIFNLIASVKFLLPYEVT